MLNQKYTRAPEFLWISVALMSLAAAVHKTYYFGLQKSLYFYGFVFIALMSLAAAVHKTYYFGLQKSLYFYGFVFIASAMWLLRRLIRKNREKQGNDL